MVCTVLGSSMYAYCTRPASACSAALARLSIAYARLNTLSVLSGGIAEQSLIQPCGVHLIRQQRLMSILASNMKHYLRVGCHIRQRCRRNFCDLIVTVMRRAHEAEFRL